MAETEDSISNKQTMQVQQHSSPKRREKALSWKNSLDFFSTCKDCTCEASETKKNRNKTKKSRKKGKNGGDLETSNSIPSKFFSSPDETSRAMSISASSSFNSSSFSSLSVSSISSSSRSFSSLGGSFKGMQIRNISASGCSDEYNPLNWVPSPSLRASLSPCNACGEIFTKPESLQIHQATQHAVSELGPEDTSRKIVEIIFQSSWLQKQSPVLCKIERILKIHNTKSTVSKFEEYRETIKLKSLDQGKRNPRCMADGNELLRFFGTTFVCNLGLDSTTHLCRSMNKCNACSIIKDGFKLDVHGKICTVATSGRAHVMVRDPLVSEGEKKAMLVCRVVAGRVKGNCDDVEEFDSLTISEGYLDDLSVFNPRAILPCFVVIYCGY